MTAAPEPSSHPSSHTLWLRGRPVLHIGGQALPLSRKATLLLVYLALEGRPVHRTTLASLLWPGEGGLRSLRVELSKLRQLGLDLAPDRSPLLCYTPEVSLAAAPDRETPCEPSQWLVGCEDHGSPDFRRWVEQQRARLMASAPAGAPAPRPDLEAGLSEAGPRERALDWLARNFARTLEQARQRARSEGHLQVVVQPYAQDVLPHAALNRALEAQDWPVIAAECAEDNALFFMSLLLRLSPSLPEAQRERLGAALAGQPDAAGLLAQLGAALLAHSGPRVVVLRHAERLSAGAEALMALAVNWPAPLVVVLLTSGALPPGLLATLGEHLPGEHVTVRSQRRVPSAALDRDPHRYARHVQQAEGLWPALQPLLDRPGAALGRRVRLSGYAPHELLGRHARLGSALAPLSMLRAPFSPEQALALLPADGEALLQEALGAGLLERVPPALSLNWPDLSPRLADDPYPLAFTSELLRSALAATLDAPRRRQLRGAACPDGEVLTPALACTPEVHPAGEPPAADEFMTSVTLGSGYAAEVWTERVSLYRLGARGHAAPELRLRLPGGLTGQASLWYRLDEYEGAAPDHALTLWQGGREVGRVSAAAGERGVWRRWTFGTGPDLELSCRADNLVLHLHGLNAAGLSAVSRAALEDSAAVLEGAEALPAALPRPARTPLQALAVQSSAV